MAELGLGVTCVGLCFGLPQGAALDSADESARQQALSHARAGLAHAASLGAPVAYVIPGEESGKKALDCYARSLAALADQAAQQGIRLCVEHFPGRGLPTAEITVEYLRATGHGNLYLLLDLGHLQLSNEEPVSAVERAADRLGYVHLDDNDGQADLHWALLDGALTREGLRAFFSALGHSGYAGPLSLELSPRLPDPAIALDKSRRLVEELLK
jgi:sugar phosphate isomerase/epimerase